VNTVTKYQTNLEGRCLQLQYPCTCTLLTWKYCVVNRTDLHKN